MEETLSWFSSFPLSFFLITKYVGYIASLIRSKNCSQYQEQIHKRESTFLKKPTTSLGKRITESPLAFSPPSEITKVVYNTRNALSSCGMWIKKSRAVWGGADSDDCCSLIVFSSHRSALAWKLKASVVQNLARLPWCGGPQKPSWLYPPRKNFSVVCQLLYFFLFLVGCSACAAIMVAAQNKL